MEYRFRYRFVTSKNNSLKIRIKINISKRYQKGMEKIDTRKTINPINSNLI